MLQVIAQLHGDELIRAAKADRLIQVADVFPTPAGVAEIAVAEID